MVRFQLVKLILNCLLIILGQWLIFYKAIIYPSDDELEIDIALKNKAGQSYEADTQIFVVVYGVAGTQSDVDVRLWDRYFYIDDKKIHFEAPIDMVNKDIENVNDLSINN